MVRIPILRAGLALVLLASAAACAQRYRSARSVKYSWRASPCRVPDAATTRHLHSLRRLASDSSKVAGGAAWHTGSKVPIIADTNHILVVLEPARCAAALAAFNTLLELSDSSATEIELLQADSVFVASHPAIMSGEWVMRNVFNSRFTYLGSYMN
jgi:hypothetical protein